MQRLTQQHILAVTLGVVYLWFGFLKFFPGCSPAEEVAKMTIDHLSLGTIPGNVAIILLAVWETVTGMILLIGLWRRPILYLTLLHLICTFTPFLLFPELTLPNPPLGFSLLGQYIAKNVILIAAVVTLLRKQK